MPVALLPIVSLYFLAAAVALGAMLLVGRRRAQPGLRWLTPILGSVSVWCLLGGLEVLTPEVGARYLYITVENTLGDVMLVFNFFFLLEFYGVAAWLTPLRRAVIFFPELIFLGVRLTNPLHHWMWTGYAPGPPGSGLISFTAGPAHNWDMAYNLVLVLPLFALLGWQFARRPDQRRTAVWIGLSMLLPFAPYLLYFYTSQPEAGLLLYPVAFSGHALLLALVLYENMETQERSHALELEKTVQALQIEIAERQRAELALKVMRDSLAQRVAEFSRQFSLLYEVIVLQRRDRPGEQALLDQALAYLCQALHAQAAGLYAAGETRPPRCLAGVGLLDDLECALPGLLSADGWDETIPRAISGATGAYLLKAVRLPPAQPGWLALAWDQAHAFDVQEIAFFGAMADQLELGLEHARLLKQVAQVGLAEERRRLARDLHDSVTQSLSSLALIAETADHRWQSGRQDGLANLLRHLALSARQALREMRLLVYEMRHDQTLKFNLKEALEQRLSSVERRVGIQAAVEIEAGLDCPASLEKELYYMIVESLNNALKHARATHVSICLRGLTSGLELEIRDDGCGFDPAANLTQAGLGLRSLHERAARLGGALRLHSAPNAGTQLTFTVEREFDAHPDR